MAKHANNSYKFEYDELIVKMGAEGASIAEFCAAIPISIQTYYNWLDRYKNFAEAAKLANTLSQAHWIKLGKDNLGNPDFNASMYHLQLGSRFGISKQRKIRTRYINSKDILGSFKKVLKGYDSEDIELTEFNELVKALLGLATVKEREEIHARVEALEKRLTEQETQEDE